MKNTIALMGMTLVLVACASASEVVPTGPNQYMVTGNAHGSGMGGHSQIEAAKKANEYCAAQHKTATVEKTSTDGNVVWSQEVTQLTFCCN